MATKRESAEYREREAMAKATKRQSSEYREREKLRLWLVSASQMTSEREKHKQRDDVVSERDLWPAASCKLLKHSLQLLKKGQITRVNMQFFYIHKFSFDIPKLQL